MSLGGRPGDRRRSAERRSLIIGPSSSDALVGMFRSATAHLADVESPCPTCGEIGYPDSAVNLALRWCDTCDHAYFVPDPTSEPL